MRLRPPAPPAATARRLRTSGLLVVATLALVAGCGAEAGEQAAAPGAARSGAPAPDASAEADGGRVRAVLDGVELSLEVADDEQERAVGLMHRRSVPPGTGMVFRYDGVSDGRYYMFQVPVPLRAVFVRDGRVVSTVVMPPCAEPVAGDCPTYGADSPYDTVVETAPETLPDVQPGDPFELLG